jgi:hypothetical protein
MIEGAIEKQPAETFVIGIDFVDYLAVGETISTQTVTSINTATSLDSSGTFLSGAPGVSGSQVLQRIVAGANGDRHIAQFRVTTSLGNTYEAEIAISVKEY